MQRLETPPSLPSVRGSVVDRIAGVVPVFLLVLAAGWWVFGFMAGRTGKLIASADIYAAFYQNMDYAVRRLRAGHGLLWNPLQNCGQPFLPVTLLGPFYPMNVVFLIFDIDRGLMVAAFLHLALAGVGTYLLCREIGMNPPAALCAAISLELGETVLHFAGWLPVTILGSFVWLPFALLCCERALRAPTLRAGAWLGLVLTLSLLGAYPQLTLFIYQLLLLRLAWELVTRGPGPLRAAAGPLALGLLLPGVLGAVYLYPAASFAALSVRGRSLRLEELAPGAPLMDLAGLRRQLAAREAFMGGFPITFAALAPLALATRDTRRHAVFYALVLVLYVALALDTPLLRLYLALPLGSLFRIPLRLIWVASFAACMLTGLGAEALLRRASRLSLRLPFLILLGVGALWAVAGSAPRSYELWAVGGLLAVACVAPLGVVSRRLPHLAIVTVPVVVGALAVHLARFQWFTFFEGTSLVRANAEVFEVLHRHMSLQDRWYGVPASQEWGLRPKAASVFELPSITDYEPQTSQRFAQLEVILRTNAAMQSVNSFYLKFTWMPRNRRVLDLLATRFLVVGQTKEKVPHDLAESLRLVSEVGGVKIYENPQAFPRAFWVPSATVEPDPARLLHDLAFGERDLRQTVLLEAPPPGGLTGSSKGTGQVRIEEDRSERVSIRVVADAPGFLVLTDQYYPGWSATVNGAPAPLLRANHAFRAIPVPAGDSTVRFVYDPWSFWLGAIVSLAALAMVAVVLGARPSRRLDRVGSSG